MCLECYRTRYLQKFENELVLLSKTPYLGKSSRQLRTGTVAEQALSNKILFFILTTYLVGSILGENYVSSKYSQNIFTSVC
jgi:hypothetical protein